MKEDIYAPTHEEVYYAAETYLPYLPDALKKRVKILLQKAKHEASVVDEIISLFSEDKRSRIWMRQALFLTGREVIKGGYEKIAGNPTSVSASQVWVCPKCNFQWHVSRAGRPIPSCPKDYSVLVPINKEV